jgi:hypothetical protein
MSHYTLNIKTVCSNNSLTAINGAKLSVLVFTNDNFSQTCFIYLQLSHRTTCRSQRPRGLRRRSAAEHLLGSWVRIPPGVWMVVSCTVFVLSGRGLCDGTIPRPEESYRLCCVSECDQVKTTSTPTVSR